MLVRLRNISLKYNIHPILDNINLLIDSNEKIALVGRNGTGKSSLLKVISGVAKADQGLIEQSPGIKIGMLDQDFRGSITSSIFDIVASGLGKEGELICRYHHLIEKAGQGCLKSIDEMQVVQEQIETAHAWGVQNQIEAIISKLELNTELKFNDLSGGLKRRVLLAKALVQHPDLLLLDEPTNHLDIEAIKWLENFLINWKTSVLFISHDRAFVRKVATRIIELDRGVLSDWPGTYEQFLVKKEESLHREELENARFDKKLANEEVWIRQGIKARRTRNEGRVLALKKMRALRAKRQDRPGSVKANIQEAEKSGQKVIEAINVTHGFNNHTIVKNFSTVIIRGDKVGIIGANGSGKTTLVHLLLDRLKPEEGEVIHGTNLEIAYFDQLRAELDDKLSVRDNLSAGSNTVNINGKEKHVIGYLQDFLFTPERANSPITVLSGGEKNRLLLAKLFAKASNLLVLDEPTNDLDVETLELLEDLLVNYTGTVLLISHDREFINNVVSSTIVFEHAGDGDVQEYVGGYDDWLAQRAPSVEINEQSSSLNGHLNKSKLSQANQNIKQDKKSLPSDQKKELALIPEKINKLEAEQKKLQDESLADGFYQKDKAIIAKTTERLNIITKELEKLYQRWEELDI